MGKPWIYAKTVIITGVTGGIGKALAELFIEKYSCRVVGVARNSERLNALAQKWGDSLVPISMDVSVNDEWIRLNNTLTNMGIRADMLINNAGVLPEFKAAAYTTASEAENVMGINFFSAVYSYHALKGMIMGSQAPAIVNIASAAALAPLSGTSLYSASKSALRAYTLAMTGEMGKKCYVSCVCPGFCDTKIFDAQSEAIPRPIFKLISMPPKRMAKKIIRGIIHKRRYMRPGVDAHLMDIMFRICPRLTLRAFSWVIKISGLGCFKSVFYKED